ncbi:MAG: flagellar hook-basal body complex protein FliE [Clostridium sp.]|uniref:flagellar hook-basal body complex protein FliE n=1 Tax=Clostridium sp. TaxID=1506 RepID=UPI003074F52A
MINSYMPSTMIFKEDLKEIYGSMRTSDEKKVEQESSGIGFAAAMKEELQKVNDKQINADNNIKGYINGEKSIHEVMLAREEASLSLELAIQVRNKLVDAYKEFNNMQV